MTEQFEIRLCKNPGCGLRYPLKKGHPFGIRCPKCLGETQHILERSLSPGEVPFSAVPEFSLSALLDNIRSAWNVGAIFRTSDGFGLEKLYLCGITPTPPNPTISKTALGAEGTIPWEDSPNALETAKKLKNQGALLWALEQDNRSIPLATSFKYDGRPIVLIVGNEVSGIDPELLDLCDLIFHIPMFGKKRSLNVEVACGIALSFIRQLHIQ